MTPEESAAHEAEQFAASETKARAQESHVPDVGRMIPASADAEQGVLSCLVLSPVEVAGWLQERRIGTAHFHIPAHATVFTVAMKIVADGGALDFITLTDALRGGDKLDRVGGAGFISSLWTYLATATNLSYYLDILCRCHMRRRMIAVCGMVAARSFDDGEDVPALLDEAEREVLGIRSTHDTASVVPIRQTVIEAVGAIEKMYESRGQVTGIPTGLSGVDDILNGLQPEFIVIAARPSQGKTAFALNVAEFITVDLGKPVAFFSAEMSRKQLVLRWVASRARVNLTAIRNGFMAERDFPALTAAAAKIAGSAFYLDDGGDMTIEGVRARARRLKREHGIAAVFIDYLQLLRSSERRKNDNSEQEISAVSKGCKAMQKELGIPVVVLAQLNREFDKRGGGARPKLSDLRGSGSIEQDADTIAFIVRPEMSAEDEEEKDRLRGRAELIVAKQRSGPLGDVPLTFLAEFTRFEDRAETSDQIEAADEEARRRDAARQKTMPL